MFLIILSYKSFSFPQTFLSQLVMVFAQGLIGAQGPGKILEANVAHWVQVPSPTSSQTEEPLFVWGLRLRKGFNS